MADRLYASTMQPDFSSPSGNVMSAALAAARSTMSPPLPPPSQPIPSHHAPIPGLRHDLMMIAGVDVGGSSSPPSSTLPPPSHPSTVPTHPPSLPAHPASLPAHPAPLPTHPSSLPTHPSLATHPAALAAHPSAIPTHPTQLPPPPNDVKPAVPRIATAGVQKRARKKSREPGKYVCDVADCGKSFRMQGDLHAHTRIHTGEEPFMCSYPMCGRRYKWRSSLAHHEGLHIRKKGALLQRRPRKSKAKARQVAQADVQGQAVVAVRSAKEEFEL